MPWFGLIMCRTKPTVVPPMSLFMHSPLCHLILIGLLRYHNKTNQSELEVKNKRAGSAKRGKTHVSQVKIGFDLASDWLITQPVCHDW